MASVRDLGNHIAYVEGVGQEARDNFDIQGIVSREVIKEDIITNSDNDYTIDDYKKISKMLKALKIHASGSNISVDDAVTISLISNYSIDDCVKKFVGKHNFKAFASSDTDVKDFNRTIYNFTFQKKDNFLIFKITGNGFLYNMVRIIIGTILDIARGKLDIDIIDKMFETGDRSIGGKTAKPNGLYLYDVEYL